MKLGQAQKEELLDTASEVYKAFVALDFFKTRKFTVEDEQLTLLELCTHAIQNKVTKKQVVLDGQVYELELLPDSKPWL